MNPYNNGYGNVNSWEDLQREGQRLAAIRNAANEAAQALEANRIRLAQAELRRKVEEGLMAQQLLNAGPQAIERASRMLLTAPTRNQIGPPNPEAQNMSSPAVYTEAARIEEIQDTSHRRRPSASSSTTVNNHMTVDGLHQSSSNYSPYSAIGYSNQDSNPSTSYGHPYPQNQTNGTYYSHGPAVDNGYGYVQGYWLPQRYNPSLQTTSVQTYQESAASASGSQPRIQSTYNTAQGGIPPMENNTTGHASSSNLDSLLKASNMPNHEYSQALHSTSNVSTVGKTVPGQATSTRPMAAQGASTGSQWPQTNLDMPQAVLTSNGQTSTTYAGRSSDVLPKQMKTVNTTTTAQQDSYFQVDTSKSRPSQTSPASLAPLSIPATPRRGAVSNPPEAGSSQRPTSDPIPSGVAQKSDSTVVTDQNKELANDDVVIISRDEASAMTANARRAQTQSGHNPPSTKAQTTSSMFPRYASDLINKENMDTLNKLLKAYGGHLIVRRQYPLAHLPGYSMILDDNRVPYLIAPAPDSQSKPRIVPFFRKHSPVAGPSAPPSNSAQHMNSQLPTMVPTNVASSGPPSVTTTTTTSNISTSTTVPTTAAPTIMSTQPPILIIPQASSSPTQPQKPPVNMKSIARDILRALETPAVEGPPSKRMRLWQEPTPTLANPSYPSAVSTYQSAFRAVESNSYPRPVAAPSSIQGPARISSSGAAMPPPTLLPEVASASGHTLPAQEISQATETQPPLPSTTPTLETDAVIQPGDQTATTQELAEAEPILEALPVQEKEQTPISTPVKTPIQSPTQPTTPATTPTSGGPTISAPTAPSPATTPPSTTQNRLSPNVIDLVSPVGPLPTFPTSTPTRPQSPPPQTKTPLFLPETPSPPPTTHTSTSPLGVASADEDSNTVPRRQKQPFYILVPPLPDGLRKSDYAPFRSRTSRKRKLASRQLSEVGSSASAYVETDEEVYNDVDPTSRGFATETLEREAVLLSCSRLSERPCKYGSCKVILNSAGKLVEHLSREHRPRPRCREFICRWMLCGKRRANGRDFYYHLREHATEWLRCAYQDCELSFRSARQLAKHHHSNHSEADALKPSNAPFRREEMPPPSPIRQRIVPTYMLEPVQMATISEASHSKLEKSVLQNISGSVPQAKHTYNAAEKRPTRSTAAATTSTQVEEEDQPHEWYEPYEFLDGAPADVYSTITSEPAQMRAYEDLDSAAVTELIEEGLVLWGPPEVKEEEADDEAMLHGASSARLTPGVSIQGRTDDDEELVHMMLVDTGV